MQIFGMHCCPFRQTSVCHTVRQWLVTGRLIPSFWFNSNKTNAQGLKVWPAFPWQQLSGTLLSAPSVAFGILGLCGSVPPQSITVAEWHKRVCVCMRERAQDMCRICVGHRYKSAPFSRGKIPNASGDLHSGILFFCMCAESLPFLLLEVTHAYMQRCNMLFCCSSAVGEPGAKWSCWTKWSPAL